MINACIEAKPSEGSREEKRESGEDSNCNFSISDDQGAEQFHNQVALTATLDKVFKNDDILKDELFLDDMDEMDPQVDEMMHTMREEDFPKSHASFDIR